MASSLPWPRPSLDRRRDAAQLGGISSRPSPRAFSGICPPRCSRGRAYVHAYHPQASNARPHSRSTHRILPPTSRLLWSALSLWSSAGSG
ncbi:hypothetical protein CALCODRAFT_248105 [Calocera cornea HHB12733]|uniref:Uncharacterized protein n=1 Tax=Calocera cornea HHB12733 TaxID=1353952 RepID=A0A165JVL0_9BASI|nr:hypothetical protein CALCODRAFT_248105 [Calocera cornea HHB12733]